jgi:hypothetical protein
VSPRGLYVWNRLDGCHTVEEIVAEHRRESDPIDTEEVARVIAELVSAGFAQVREIREDVAHAISDRSLLARIRRFVWRALAGRR